MPFCEIVGATVGIVFWRQLERGLRWLTVWIGVAAFVDVAALISARIIHNNELIIKLWLPVSALLAAEAMASLQHSARRRRALRLVGAGYLVAWLVLMLTVETPDGFAKLVTPLNSLVLIVVAVATMLRRVTVGRIDLLLDGSFLAGAALLAYAAPTAFFSPLVQILEPSHNDLLGAYYVVRVLINDLAVLLMARAFVLSAPSTHLAMA